MDIWVAQAQGTGTRTVDWTPADGDWTVAGGEPAPPAPVPGPPVVPPVPRSPSPADQPVGRVPDEPR